MRVVVSADIGEWNRQLARCGRFDVYHLAEYHRTAEKLGEGEALLLVFEAEGEVAALPLLRRPLWTLSGLEDVRLYDAASAYGYPGLLCSCDIDSPAAERFRREFQESLDEALRSLEIVSFFGRQHPLIDTAWLWGDAYAPLGPTVAIDLTRSEQSQWSEMRSNHRRDIRRAEREGVVVVEDTTLRRLDEFRRIYEETMRTVGAASQYFFSEAYYRSLRENLGRRIKLFFAEYEGRPVAAAMFFLCGRIIQYHLGGTDELGRDRLRSPIKAIFDHVRRWGKAADYHWLHLGGGLGARRDSLYRFKAGFTKNEFTFGVVRKIVDAAAYRELVAKRCGKTEGDCEEGYFPAYRRPINALRAA
ncbi:MAG: GNAT family N-acetyltransferase [Planctomycetota bacterium]|nr:MAG: GNAT family N-acetyltransferase [Planctomycetota bacterium]